MTRRCSHCNSNGHNTRTCPTRGGSGAGGLRLFGVRVTDGSFIQKSASMGNIHSHYSPAAASDSANAYHSDDPDHRAPDRRRPIRKKGIPWTEEEHRQFLLGLQNLGKGDWRGISKNYVRSRTSTQVASHAQKYFIRQSNATRKKKRSSLFDMVPDTEKKSSSPECQLRIPTPMASIQNGKLMLSSSSQVGDTENRMPCLDLSLKPAFTPFPLQLWPPNANSHEDNHSGKSLKVPVVKEEPIHELMSLSQLTLGETGMLQNESLTFSLSVAGNP